MCTRLSSTYVHLLHTVPWTAEVQVNRVVIWQPVTYMYLKRRERKRERKEKESETKYSVRVRREIPFVRSYDRTNRRIWDWWYGEYLKIADRVAIATR